MPRPSPVKTRVAVVQLDYIPAIRLNRQSPFENPTFSLSNSNSNWLEPQASVSEEIKAKLKSLRARVRDIYTEQLLGKIQTILDACRRWKVKIIVFPEYSIPWEILRDVMNQSRGITIVAGTHRVERQALETGAYSSLGWSNDPEIAQAVCPVFHDGNVLALQPKLSAAKPEIQSIELGKSWSPISIPGIHDSMGILICLDFLYRERDTHRELVGKSLDTCGFVAVPSLTPYFTTDEFEAVSLQESLRYRRPVLYADCASGGGSSIYVDTGRSVGKSFPDVIGKLHRNDEGVLIADVDLGYQPRGESTSFFWTPPIVPFAGASLVYQRHPLLEEYSNFSQELILDDRNASLTISQSMQRIEARQTHLRDVIALKQGVGCQFRSERITRMLDQLDGIDRFEELQKFLRELPLSSGLLPLRDLQAVLSKSCSEIVEAWSHEPGGESLREAANELRKEASPSKTCQKMIGPMPPPRNWTKSSKDFRV